MMVTQDRAARTRRSLIRAAAEIFAVEGFVPASLTMISRRAGVSNGALHFHFKSKEALAGAVEEEAAREVRLITECRDGDEVPVLQLLVDATHALMLRLDEDVVLQAGFELSGEHSRLGGVDLWRQWRGWTEGLLQRASSDGELAHGVSPDAAADVLLAATVGFEVLGARDGKEWISGHTLARFWELMLPGLAARPDSLIAPGSPGVVRPRASES
ncbi:MULTISPECIES: ScbR family autoregulator-binding transcription factor [unclassified Streptomyces]|uniref:ScbR family autoregulator-binding transcription factor n=1 Tax=unclassified Streptomyces TaxID=2593676 RepID=UPI0036266822